MANDGYSRERVQALLAAHKEVSILMPEMRFGVSLFGSLSKAKHLTRDTQERADMDFAYFYDTDDLRLYDTELQNRFSSYKELLGIHGTPVDADTGRPQYEGGHKAFKAFLAQQVAGLLAEKLALKNNTPLDLADAPEIFTISKTGPDSILACVQDLDEIYKSDYLDNSRYSNAQVRVARFFHLDVGGRLKKYRQDFLTSLLKLPAHEAQNLWGWVNGSVRRYERKDGIPPKAERQFPRTLHDACEYYQVSLRRRESTLT